MKKKLNQLAFALKLCQQSTYIAPNDSRKFEFRIAFDQKREMAKKTIFVTFGNIVLITRNRICAISIE